ncbi:hydrogenase/urease nickel incorporation protein HypA [Shewanella sp. D64]|uniref:hydrogenase/urease nickel incorporation protein HypA n=1 Tax=unclassified Shewanella TaxID=196818 RepID=UPI0022BA4066|nr:MULTISPECIES: hydrogenase/urease nickel incorporation protein HypA [unclassified Shewanella]MEC4725380.1 hydrogenase/urease nickel incorporation protein HypA [Shewanella sp. D64]MEC4735774.1 hydrogenase/urease nickel incorporation protein HypA [Shewanella sp. E94]WBJ93254.1 hydrogenase/urease nickel incorporation protein HypA [Shewanella sp. MTB7]
MHEYSIVSALIEQCEQLAFENKANKITRVAIKIGVMSGVEPSLLSTAFDTFKLGGICQHAELEMQIQPLVLQCYDCDGINQLNERNIICPQCKSSHTKLIEGEEMLLMQLELETE